MNDYNIAFFNAQTCFNNKEYIKAKYWYNISIESEEYYELSLIKLIQIAIKDCNYLEARKLLNKSTSNNVRLKSVKGLLETVENNIIESRKYYSQCMDDYDTQYDSLYKIAKTYVQTGDNMIARKMFETLQLNNNFYIQATFNLIYLEILEENYEKAYLMLKTIKLDNLLPLFAKNYRVINHYLSLKLNLSIDLEQDMDYITSILYKRDEQHLLEHINRHTIRKNDSYKEGYFFKYIDLKKLLNVVRYKIYDMNANHFDFADTYRIRLDDPIGFKDEQLTNDICVTTIIGTKDIITIYPIKLSDEFDKEGFSYDKKISLKRKNVK